MSANKEISDYRSRIDAVDQEIMKKLEERLDLAQKEAELRQAEGLPIEDLIGERARREEITQNAPEDMATYEKLIDLCRDNPDVIDPLRYLREREVVHFQRFGEALRGVQDKLAEKKFYMNDCK